MRLAIVNAFYPPDQAITGRSAKVLVQQLREALPEMEVTVFATDRSYSAGVLPSAAQHHAERIRASYRGTAPLLRLAASLWDGIRLARRACRYGDIVISMTDPPLLGLWVAIESFRKHRMWIEWTMDLYPEAFAAAGLSSPDGVLYTFVLKALQKWKPVRYICLGPLQHRWIRAHREIDRPAFILPCGTCDVLPGDVPAWRTDDRIILAYAGNLGEAHSADVVAQIVTRADPRRFAFVLATYGAKVAGLRERTRGFANITWCSHLSHSDLAHADVHIVSLLGKWAHICVPSKAVAAVCLGRPILFAGPPDTDTWNQLGSAGWLIAETSDGGYETRDIDRALEGIGTGKEREYKTQQANSLRSKLRLLEGEELGRIVGWLAQFAGRGDPGHAALKPDDISTDSMIGARTATGPNRGES